MNEPVTIGNQTFIRDPQLGWIDKKTKVKADEGLTKLLDSLQPESAVDVGAAQKKKRIKIDRNIEPVSIGGQSFVFDMNAGAWIDAKTKQAAPPSLQKVLTETVNKNAVKNILGVTQDVEQTFGVIGQIAKGKVKLKATGTDGVAIEVAPKKKSGAAPIKSKKNISPLNPLIISMIDHLASIDDTLKSMNVASLQSKRQAAEQADEDRLEGKDNVDEIVEEDKKEHASRISKGTLAGGAALGALLVTAYIDPIARALSQVIDFTTEVGDTVVDMARALNKFFGFFNGDLKESEPAQQPDIPDYDPNKVKDKSEEEPEKAKPTVAPVPAAPPTKPKVEPRARPPVRQEKSERPTEQRQQPPAAPAPAPASTNNPWGLNPKLRDALNAANDEYYKATGRRLIVTDGRRSAAKQKEYWDESVRQGTPGRRRTPAGNVYDVAPPGKSDHERGDAVDIYPYTGKNQIDTLAIQILNKYGLYQPIPKTDFVHFILRGGGSRQEQKNSKQEASPPPAPALAPTSGSPMSPGMQPTSSQPRSALPPASGSIDAILNKTPQQCSDSELRRLVEAQGRFEDPSGVTNNPGGILYGSGFLQEHQIGYKWSRGTYKGKHMKIAVFDTPENGIRAAIMNWRRNKRYRGKTIREGLRAWSGSESDDQLNQYIGWLRKAKPGYTGTRNPRPDVTTGRVRPSSQGPVAAVESAVESTFDAVSNFTGPDTRKIDYQKDVNEANVGMGVGDNAEAIQRESAKMFGDKVQAATPPPPPPPPMAPNLNAATPQLAPREPAESDASAKVLNGYMKYFRINKIDITNNIPILTLPRTRTTIWNP